MNCANKCVTNLHGTWNETEVICIVIETISKFCVQLLLVDSQWTIDPLDWSCPVDGGLMYDVLPPADYYKSVMIELRDYNDPLFSLGEFAKTGGHSGTFSFGRYAKSQESGGIALIVLGSLFLCAGGCILTWIRKSQRPPEHPQGLLDPGWVNLAPVDESKKDVSVKPPPVYTATAEPVPAVLPAPTPSPATQPATLAQDSGAVVNPAVDAELRVEPAWLNPTFQP